jgi:hypothetical protein
MKPDIADAHISIVYSNCYISEANVLFINDNSIIFVLHPVASDFNVFTSKKYK